MRFRLIVLSIVLLALAATAFAQQAPTQTPPAETIESLKQQLDRLQNRMKDWPQLNRYKDANTKVPAPEKNEDRVVFMGDSITDGWKLAEYFPDKPYINRGISGQTTPQMLIRFRPDVIALKPKAVVILAGTNDIAGNTGPMTIEMITANYASMADLAKANGIKVIFASVLPIHDYGKTKVSERRSPENILKLNDWLKSYCKANNHTYLDYFSKTVDDKGMLKAELATDGLHPNADGYKIMAPLAEAAIQQTLKK
ncbi:MAG TPA: SGNH/GDSL hydrolase family protein [Blastocatellia bacterium]|nr:SGNH/GDSL hydrolase family protein [Blastocatellia bacterium]